MRTNILHSNLLGRLGNGLLKFVVMVCNVSGAFATTYSEDKTYSEPITIFPTGDVITINPGVTLTINSEVTIMGNLINNGGTIIVGEGGVLTVTGNVTNTSVSTGNTYNTFSIVETYQRKSGRYYEDSELPKTNPQNNDRKYVVEKSRNINIGNIVVSNGGEINITGDLSNDAASITIETTASESISSVIVHGNLTNTETTVSYTEKTKTTQSTYYNNYGWYRDNGYPQEQNETKSFVSNITLSNGYLLVDGNVELQDNSTVTFAGSGIGENVESTIRVRKNDEGNGGDVTQSENAIITLSPGAKGTLVVQNTYEDNTNVTTTDFHPWYMNDDELEVSDNFSFFVQSYNSTYFQTTLQALQNQYNSYQDGSMLYYFGSDKEKWENDNRYQWWYYREDYRTYYWQSYISTPEYLEKIGNYFVTAIEYYGDEDVLAALSSLKTDGFNASEIDDVSSSISTLLPIELTSFTATATDYGFAFNWVTASEVENDYFTLEYSIDGVDFSEIDYIHGAGTTSETSEYEYRWDEAPEFDVVYFRLKQTDYNGEYSYSDVIAASRKKSSGANGTFRYGPLNLQIQDGELRYIVK